MISEGLQESYGCSWELSELQNKLGSGGLFAHDAIALKVNWLFI